MEVQNAFAIIICFSLLSSGISEFLVPREADAAVVQEHHRYVRRVAPTLEIFESEKCTGQSDDLTDCHRFCMVRRFRYGGCNSPKGSCICSDKPLDLVNYEGGNRVFL